MTGCAQWRAELVEHARGTAPASAGLSAHLDGCPACRRERDQLAAVAALLHRVDPAALLERLDEPPVALRGRVVGAVGARRLLALVAAAVVAVGLAGAVGVSALTPTPASTTAAPVPATVALGVEETVVPWGTRLQVRVEGLPADGPFRLWVEDADGARTPIGSFGPTTDGSALVPAATELAPSGIRRVGISSADGDVLAAVDT